MVASTPTVGAERLGDHRIEYLHEEGPLGGNRGEVRRVEAGTYQEVAREGGAWCVRLDGGAVRGEIVLSDMMIAHRII
jgi:hypothetical protein